MEKPSLAKNISVEKQNFLSEISKKMKINNLSTEHKNNFSRVAATIIWENCARPEQEIYFETTTEFADGLSCNPNAFLVASTMPAFYGGEERIAIDADICPELYEGIETALGWVNCWYKHKRQPLRLEVNKKAHLPKIAQVKCAGFFFSGGIDSLSVLRANRLNFSLDHPRSIQDGLIIHGIEEHTVKDPEKQLEDFRRHLNALSAIADDAQINLIPVYTNVRSLNNSVKFWQYYFCSAALASVAHAFSNRLDEITIASSEQIKDVEPYGSNPILDPNYSSSNLRVRHGSILMSRLEKTKLVADWDVALNQMKPCTRNLHGKLNCGRCEKCIRTMTTLVALGKLEKSMAFPCNDVNQELLISGAYIDNPGAAGDYLALVNLLQTQGRSDLVKTIERIMVRYQEQDFRGIIKRIDRQFFKGKLINSVKKIKHLQRIS